MGFSPSTPSASTPARQSTRGARSGRRRRACASTATRGGTTATRTSLSGSTLPTRSTSAPPIACAMSSSRPSCARSSGALPIRGRRRLLHAGHRRAGRPRAPAPRPSHAGDVALLARARRGGGSERPRGSSPPTTSWRAGARFDQTVATLDAPKRCARRSPPSLANASSPSSASASRRTTRRSLYATTTRPRCRLCTPTPPVSPRSRSGPAIHSSISVWRHRLRRRGRQRRGRE